PPVLAPVANQSVLKNQLLEFTIPGTDPDYDPITYAANPLPPGATVNPATGIVSWIPDSTQGGAYQIALTATDARGLSATTTTLVTVLSSPTDGLISQWKLDEASGTTAFDSVGTNDGTLLNFNFNSVSGWTPGKID